MDNLIYETKIEVPKLTPFWWLLFIGMIAFAVMAAYTPNNLMAVGGWLVSAGLWYLYGRQQIQLYLTGKLIEALGAAMGKFTEHLKEKGTEDSVMH